MQSRTLTAVLIAALAALPVRAAAPVVEPAPQAALAMPQISAPIALLIDVKTKEVEPITNKANVRVLLLLPLTSCGIGIDSIAVSAAASRAAW